MWGRLVDLARRKRLDRELEAELAHHFDALVGEHEARGLTPAAAHVAAQRDLGGLARVRETYREQRGLPGLDGLWQDVRYALRTFRRLPGFATVALLVLGLGVASTTVMFTVIEGVLLRPLPYPQPERLATLSGFSEKSGVSRYFSYPDFRDAQHDSHALILAAWTYASGTVTAPGEAAHVDARGVSAELFSVFGVPLAQGQAFRPEDDRPGAAPVVIISNGLWRRRYGGSRAAIGQPLVFEGKSYSVAGVAPAGFELGGEADVFLPLGQSTEPRMQNRGARFIRVVARVAPGVTWAEGQAELTLIGRRLSTAFPASSAGRDLLARPLQQDVVGDVGSLLWLLLGAVGAVLSIACVNIASLLLARAVSREGELATRVALGASRGRVMRQCLTESAVLGLAGGALGVLVAAVGVRPFVALWPGSLPRAGEIHIDWRVLLAALTVSLASGLAFGLVPALRVPLAGLEGALRASGRTVTGSTRRLYGVFVVAEIALAVVLLVSAGMLVRTLLTLSALDTGLRAQNVLTARVALAPRVLGSPAQIEAAWTDVLDRARRVPGVESVALTDIVPMREGSNTGPYSTTAIALPPNEAPIALATSVTPDYLGVMGISLLAGRFFDAHDRMDGAPVLVVDENLALHAFGRRDVVGRQLWVADMGPSPFQIVGVVGHVRHWGLAADDGSRVRDQMYYPFAQVPPRLLRTFSSLMSIVIRTKIPPSDVVEPLRTALLDAGGDQTLYEIRTMPQLVSASLARQRFLVLLFAIFGGVALLLSVVGVYGVLAYLTSQRGPELAVRVALGATAADVMRLVVGQSARLIAFGVVIGVSGAWAAGRVLGRFVEGMRPGDTATFLVMTSVLVAAALSASLVPARRAAQLGALHALRRD